MTRTAQVRGPSTPPLAPTTLAALLERAAARAAEVPALTDHAMTRTLTHGDMYTRAHEMARGFVWLGVRPGDRVAIWSDNRADWILAHHGAALAGAIVVTVNPALRAAEVAYVLSHCGALWVVSPTQCRGRAMEPILREAAVSCPELVGHIVLGKTSFAVPGLHCATLDEIASEGGDRALPRPDADAPLSLQYTSGTTGRPKGALLRQRC